MTPERLQLVAERLREFAPELDDEAIGRMLRAVDPKHENMLATRVAVVVREHLDQQQRSHERRLTEIWGLQMGADSWARALHSVGSVDLTPIIDRIAPLSPAETPIGAATHRPEDEPLCGNCGHDFLSHANGIRPCDERAHGNAAECGCRDWTLVGPRAALRPRNENQIG